MGEVRRLAAMRAVGKTIPECAALLRRTPGAVAEQCRRSGLVKAARFRNGEVAGLIRRLHRKGWCDERIALRLRRSRFTVADHRRRLGLPANPAPHYTARVVCMGCGRRSPVVPGPGWTNECGWRTRVATKGHLVTTRDSSCPECFAAYGWGDQLAGEPAA